MGQPSRLFFSPAGYENRHMDPDPAQIPKLLSNFHSFSEVASPQNLIRFTSLATYSSLQCWAFFRIAWLSDKDTTDVSLTRFINSFKAMVWDHDLRPQQSNIKRSWGKCNYSETRLALLINNSRLFVKEVNHCFGLHVSSGLFAGDDVFKGQYFVRQTNLRRSTFS